MQLALYRGPGAGLTHRLGHLLTVAVLSVRSLRKFADENPALDWSKQVWAQL